MYPDFVYVHPAGRHSIVALVGIWRGIENDVRPDEDARRTPVTLVVPGLRQIICDLEPGCFRTDEDVVCRADGGIVGETPSVAGNHRRR